MISKDEILEQKPLVIIILEHSKNNNGIEFKVVDRKKSIFSMTDEVVDSTVVNFSILNDSPVELVKEVIFNCRVFNYDYILYEGQKITEDELVLNFFTKEDKLTRTD